MGTVLFTKRLLNDALPFFKSVKTKAFRRKNVDQVDRRETSTKWQEEITETKKTAHFGW